MQKLFIDIETTPLLGYTWGVYQDNINQIETYSKLLCVSWKIDGQRTRVASTRTMKEKDIVKLIWELFDSSDIIIAHNGDKFDIRVINSKFLEYNLTPPSPYKTVDTLKVARKYFKLPSNRLDAIGEQFGLGRKIHTDFQLWLDCMAGNDKALRTMERYNIQDVNLLYNVYYKMSGFMTNHPNYNLYFGTTHQCPVCGGNTQRRGIARTRVRNYQRYQCTSKTCGAWSQGELITSDKTIK